MPPMRIITFKIDGELLRRLENYCRIRGATRSEIIREALTLYLNTVEKKLFKENKRVRVIEIIDLNGHPTRGVIAEKIIQILRETETPITISRVEEILKKKYGMPVTQKHLWSIMSELKKKGIIVNVVKKKKRGRYMLRMGVENGAERVQ